MIQDQGYAAFQGAGRTNPLAKIGGRCAILVIKKHWEKKHKKKKQKVLERS